MADVNHDTYDHTDIPGVPAAEAFTEAVHDAHDHTGLPGVPAESGAAAPSSSSLSAPLARYYAALTHRDSAPVDIVCIGDSVTEGYLASGLDVRWTDRLLAALTRSYDPDAEPVAIYRPAAWGVSPGFALPWTIVSAAPFLNYGLGRRANTLSTGGSMTITETCTGFDLFYVQNDALGSFAYAVDGGTAVTVDGSSLPLAGGKRERVTGLTRGEHTVVITPVSGASVIEGIIFYDGNEDSGIHVWEGGHGGYATTEFVDVANPHWIDVIGTIQPALVIIELGLNDIGNGVSTSTFATNLETLIANVRALTTIDPSILLMVAHQVGTQTPAEWAPYVAAMRDVADDDGDIAVLEMAPGFGGYVTPTTATDMLNSDLVHPTDEGHELYADTLYPLLAAATPEQATAATITAADVPITDAGAYFSSSHTEGALQEVGASLAGLTGGDVPAGGTTGQALIKASSTDFDTEWSTAPGGGAAALDSPVVVIPAGVDVRGASTFGLPANLGQAYPVQITGPMQLRGLTFRVATGGSGTVQWGLFRYGLDPTACTKIAGGSAALSTTGFVTIAADSAPVAVDAGNYMLIFKGPASNSPVLYYGALPTGIPAVWKLQTSYTWSDTPDLTSGWSVDVGHWVIFLRGDLNDAGTQW